MNTTAQVKKTLKKSAKTFTDEPLEILKTAQRQVSGEELSQNNQKPPEYQDSSSQVPQEESIRKEQGIIADNKNLESLQTEMRDIRRQKLFESLLQKIQSGEYVAVEDFQELSHEQRDVLKAQLEAKTHNSQLTTNQPLIEPMAKRGRRFGGFGKRKNAAEKQATRVEMPLPPSG